MHTESIRINITLPKDLLEALNHIAGPRSRSRLIAASLQQYLRQIEQTELEKQLEEGYRRASKENMDLAREFEAADLEGWDDY